MAQRITRIYDRLWPESISPEDHRLMKIQGLTLARWTSGRTKTPADIRLVWTQKRGAVSGYADPPVQLATFGQVPGARLLAEASAAVEIVMAEHESNRHALWDAVRRGESLAAQEAGISTLAPFLWPVTARGMTFTTLLSQQNESERDHVWASWRA